MTLMIQTYLDNKPSMSARNTRKTQQSELIDKARSFLASPEIRSADISAKKEFLKSKGLREEEIDQLMSSNEVCKLTDLARFQ
jgi:hypothetical protein